MDLAGSLESGYGVRSAVDIVHFLYSLMNVVEVVDVDGSTSTNSDEDVQLFALVLITSAIEPSGEGIRKHPKLLRMVQDDLFHHLIHYVIYLSPILLSMICSTVLSIYNFLRRYMRLQLEAFFTYVLLRVAGGGDSIQLQEVALEGCISFCRQPTFVVEMEPFVMCDYHSSLGRDMFGCISGPAVATLCAVFEQGEDDQTLNECFEGIFSVSGIARFGQEDTLDELLASFCKFTMLLNPYASAEETLYAFSNDLKPRMATWAVFTIANSFPDVIRGGWSASRNH